MNTIIIGLGTLVVAGGTVYLIKRCFFNRGVEVTEGTPRVVDTGSPVPTGSDLVIRDVTEGTKTTDQDTSSSTRAAPAPAVTPAVTKKTEITAEGHQLRTKKLKELEVAIRKYGNLTMNSVDFINFVKPILEHYNENGDMCKASETIDEKLVQNRNFFYSCFEMLELCVRKLINGKPLSYASNKMEIQGILDCFTKYVSVAPGRGMHPFDYIREKGKAFILDKVNFEEVEHVDQVAFFDKYQVFVPDLRREYYEKYRQSTQKS